MATAPGATLCVLAMMASLSSGFTPTTEPNMNGPNKYMLQPTPHGQDVVANWSTEFRDYPGGVEYFEVYAGPITTTYSEVFWTGLPAVELPPDLVKRFDDKVMAVVGFEADQVRRTPDGDVSVPITVAYNHHYGANLIGKGSSMKRVRVEETTDHRAMHPGPEPGYANIPVEHTRSKSGYPTSMVFGYSNGGEFRKTYHGLVPPFAQLIDSPQSIHVTPMQIDTWNRDKMNVTGGQFVPGPQPALAYAPVTGPDAIYSGLLECPLTTRIRKHLTGGGWNDSYSVQLMACSTPINDSKTCFQAAQQVGLPTAPITSTGTSTGMPSGCSIEVNASGSYVYYNSFAKSSVGCGAGIVSAIAGHQKSLISFDLSIDSVADNVSITITGPNSVWFGVGFDTQYMQNSPYAIIVDGSGAVTERVLGDHTPGVQLNTSVKVVSNTVEGGLRTIVVERSLVGLTPQHHTFSASQMSMNFIDAIGSSATFGYHKSKGTSTMSLWPVSTSYDPTVKGGDFGFFTASSTDGKFRNDYDGEVGYEIETMRDLTLTALGRAGAHLKAPARVTVWEASTGKAVVSEMVGAFANATVSNGYTYVNLSQPLQLKGGSKYRISLGCTPNMPDSWIDTNENAEHSLPMLARIGDGYFIDEIGKLPNTDSTPGRWAGIATFMVQVEAHNTTAVQAPSCVCAIPAAPFGKGEGTIEYLPTGETIGFPFRCNLGEADFSVMKNENPTCDIRTYVGGLSTCHHAWHLLDAEQDLPWQDQPITYYLKYRLYYQEFSPPEPSEPVTDASHINVFDITWSIAGATGEYDVPKCAPGTPVEMCTHEISGTIVPPGDDYHFVAAHYHCHAPTCISLEIWNNRTGELLCKEVPYHGATSASSQMDRFDEPGYIAQRVCLWGLHPPFEYPPFVSGETLWVKAVTNSTYGHHGEMALPQMLLASIPNTSKTN